MQLIDRYAYGNRARAVAPAQKAGLSLLVVALCLLLDRPAVGLLAAGWMWALAGCWAGLPASVFGRILLAEGSFLLLAAAGIALSPGPGSPGDGWHWSLGPVALGCSRSSLAAAGGLAARALGCAAAMNFLALTTPLVDLLDLMRRLRVPALLLDLMTLIYRFLFTLLDSATRIRVAQDSRLGYSSPRRSLASAGVLGARLLVEACHRSRRLEVALECRGYAGDLRVLPAPVRQDRWLPWLGAGLVVSLLLVGMLT